MDTVSTCMVKERNCTGADQGDRRQTAVKNDDPRRCRGVAPRRKRETIV